MRGNRKGKQNDSDERQRLALARAILHNPKILFLDEPTNGLDPGTARGIHKLIQNLRDKGATVFLTTHNMEEATKLCNSVALLHKGQIVERGAPAEICERHHAMKMALIMSMSAVMVTGIIASIVLGATIGMLAKSFAYPTWLGFEMQRIF